MTIRRKAMIAVLTLMVAWAAPLLAREPEASGPKDAVVSVHAAGGEDGPLTVVAQFLVLAPEQVRALAQLLGQRQETVAPILQEITRREQRIGELIASGGDPAEIGRLEIHQLRQLAEAQQAQFLAAFQSLLDDEQRGRWQQIHVAAGLQPVLPAFQALQIL
jgi:hypothetical protein